MPRTLSLISQRLGHLARNVTVALIAGVCRWRTITDIDAAFRSRPFRQQALASAAVLSGVFALSLLAAQFGWVGLLVFWLAVIAIVN